MADNPHSIPLKDAIALTARWRQDMPEGGFKAARFDRIAFDTLLAQPGCAGIRIYMGMNVPGESKHPSLWNFVMIGTDANGNDIIGTGGAAGAAESGEGDGDPQELSEPCPPWCDPNSPLNGDVPPP